MADVGGDHTKSSKRSYDEMVLQGGRPRSHYVPNSVDIFSSGTCPTPDHAQSSNLGDARPEKKQRVESPSPEVTTYQHVEDNKKNSRTMLEDPAGSLSSATSPDVEKYSPKNDACHDETLYLIAGILCARPTTREYFDGLKVQQKLIKRLKELSEKERRYEDDLEMAELVYLLKLLSPSNPMLETFGKKAGKGAMMLLEGDRIMTEGRDLLRSAITDISNFTE